VSHSSLPSATSEANAATVNDFVMDAMGKIVWGVTGCFVSMSRAP